MTEPECEELAELFDDIHDDAVAAEKHLDFHPDIDLEVLKKRLQSILSAAGQIQTKLNRLS